MLYTTLFFFSQLLFSFNFIYLVLSSLDSVQEMNDRPLMRENEHIVIVHFNARLINFCSQMRVCFFSLFFLSNINALFFNLLVSAYNKIAQSSWPVKK